MGRYRRRSEADLVEGIGGVVDWFQFEKGMTVLYEGRGWLVERRGGADPHGGIEDSLIMAKIHLHFLGLAGGVIGKAPGVKELGFKLLLDAQAGVAAFGARMC